MEFENKKRMGWTGMKPQISVDPGEITLERVSFQRLTNDLMVLQIDSKSKHPAVAGFGYSDNRCTIHLERSEDTIYWDPSKVNNFTTVEVSIPENSEWTQAANAGKWIIRWVLHSKVTQVEQKQWTDFDWYNQEASPKH
jgi:hypothetical protein